MNVRHCDICNSVAKPEEDMYLFQLKKRGLFAQGRAGDICFSCKQKLDKTLNDIKGNK